MKGDVFKKLKLNQLQKERLRKELIKDRSKNFFPVIKIKECCPRTGRIIFRNVSSSFWNISEDGRKVELVKVNNPREWVEKVSALYSDSLRVESEF